MESDYTEKKKHFPVIPCGPGPAEIPQGLWMKQRSNLSGLNYVLSLQSHLQFIKPTSLQSLNKTRVSTNVQKINN